MKHLHMLMALLTILAFCYSAFCILSKKPVGKAFMAVSHSLYAVLIGSGLYLLWLLGQAGAGAQHWAYAKIVLLVVAVSSMIKARKSVGTVQSKAGVVIAFVSLVAILALAYTKPILGA